MKSCFFLNAINRFGRKSNLFWKKMRKKSRLLVRECKVQFWIQKSFVQFFLRCISIPTFSFESRKANWELRVEQYWDASMLLELLNWKTPRHPWWTLALKPGRHFSNQEKVHFLVVKYQLLTEYIYFLKSVLICSLNI